MKKIWILFTLFLFNATISLAQYAHQLDSLSKAYSSEKDDLKKIKGLLSWSDILVRQNADSSLTLGKLALDICESKLKQPEKFSNDELRNYTLAHANTYNLLGFVTFTQGKVKQALDYFLAALKIHESVKNNPIGVSECYGNLAAAYSTLDNFKNAIMYHEKAIAMQLKYGYKKDAALSFNNIGMLHYGKKDDAKAQYYFLKSLKLREELKDTHGLALSYCSLGMILSGRKKYDSAFKFFDVAVKYYIKLHDLEGEGNIYMRVGKSYFAMGNMAKATEFALKSYSIAKIQKFPRQTSNACSILYQIYKKTGQAGKALTMYEEFVAMNDSINNRELKNLAIQQQLKFEFEKKATADSLKNNQEKKLAQVDHENEITRQKNITYSGIAGFALMLIIAIISLNAYRQKQKANKLIELQKQLVEEKQKEIIDSINYAKRIQTAILAREEDIKKQFPESFLFYRPKDIVAGDFYFFETTASHIFYAAADCTGHGVPGALVSVVCSNALSRCVKEFKLTDVGNILDKARELVIENFKKSGQEVKDGMDISLLVKDLRTNIYTWAGANNSLWIVKGKNSDVPLIEIKPDKQPIGLIENQKPFTTHLLEVEKGDTVLLFTDGLADQFGGPKGKKFKYKQLSAFFVNQRAKTLNEQKAHLDKVFNDWKGQLEQVDDVCVIAVRV